MVVPEGVVDLFELVEVEDQQRNGRMFTQRLLQAGFEQGAIGEAREVIVERLAPQRVGDEGRAGDVVEGQADGPPRQREGVHREHLRVFGVGAQDHAVSVTGSARLDHIAQQAGQCTAGQLGQHVVEGGPEHLGKGAADGALGGRVGGDEPQGGGVVVIGAQDQQGHLDPFDDVGVLTDPVLGPPPL